MAITEYAGKFSNVLRDLYGQELKSDALFNSNTDLQIVNGQYIKIPQMSVSGLKDHTRGGSYNTGSVTQNYQMAQLDHDRDREIPVDAMDVDESNQVVTVANITKRFETTQAIPELDAYTFSKLHSEYVRVGGTVDSTVLTAANILSKIDDVLAQMEDKGVPLERVLLYCTSAIKKLIKNAPGLTRMLDAANGNGIDRRFKTIDDIQKIETVPTDRFKTAYNFTDGFTPDANAAQINMIIIDPEAQVSRVKHSFIKWYTPGSDSRVADGYLWQYRRYNGTFAIDEMILDGCYINAQ